MGTVEHALKCTDDICQIGNYRVKIDEGNSILSVFAIVEHDLGPLCHVIPMGRGELAHVLQSQVVEGRKLEREGEDRRDQEKGQVGRDGGKWVNSGLGKQDSFHCAAAGRNRPGRLVAAGGKDRDPVEGRLTQNHTNALCVACTEQQAKWLADIVQHDGGAVA